MKISIGIPFYNAENYLEGAIRSVFAQTYRDWELILIDDGSTDASLEIARAVDDPRVRVISDGKNLKLASRLNQLVELSETDFVVRMDADDLMPSDRIERQMRVFKDNPDVDIVSSGLLSMTDDNQVLGVRWHSATSITRDQLLRKQGCGIVHAAVIGRKAWFQRNPYDPKVLIAQDYDLWLRSSKKNDLNAYIIQAPLYYVREASSVTVEKLLRSYRFDRRAVWKNKRTLWDTRFIAKSLMKSVALRVILAMGKMDWLVKRRNTQSVAPELVEKFHQDLTTIAQTSVKGLSVGKIS